MPSLGQGNQFKTIIESVPAGILMVNSDGLVVLCNAELERMFGYSPGEIDGILLEQLVPGRYRQNHPGYRKSFMQHPSKRQMGAGRELTALCKDGREIPVEIGLNHIEIDGFEKFWQADSGINRRRMGLGLGLSIVKHIAELHGGTVSIESPGVGQGTVFHVRLPVNSAVSSVSSAFPSSKRPSDFYENMAARDVSLDGLSIFLLDDSEDTLALLKRLLEKQSAAVTECSLPKKALEMLKVGDYDLLISDIGMPEMDGYEMLKSLRKWEKKFHPGKHIPAIALSAYSADEDIQKAKDSGFHLSERRQVRGLLERQQNERLWTFYVYSSKSHL
ncbi:response regulator [Bdellovibrio bacteriovorus]|uniref:response regulator n=1 Tax=Bdellovibrio bacteriovorus TaxID=959 RepID=UPI0021D2DE16|nr:response regulator [Bdellovibrio bacteriovorus]UXR63752.1 response regulator [Bdellovibrio bacteriovorus]